MINERKPEDIYRTYIREFLARPGSNYAPNQDIPACRAAVREATQNRTIDPTEETSELLFITVFGQEFEAMFGNKTQPKTPVIVT